MATKDKKKTTRRLTNMELVNSNCPKLKIGSADIEMCRSTVSSYQPEVDMSR
jgi:hypothetical protein